MSTKSTMAYGEGYHLYREMYEDGLYLEWDCGSTRLLLQISETRARDLAAGLQRYLKEIAEDAEE